MTKRRLCRFDELPDPGTRGFSIVVSGQPPMELFVVRRDESIYAYRNRCPHTGAPLEWRPHQFLDAEDVYIQCAIHGALFRIDDGYCVQGPCAGQSLSALRVAERTGDIIVDLS